MATYIRLTDYKSSDEKEKGFFDPKNRYEAKQEDFFKIPGSPIAYWVSDKIKNIFESSQSIGDVSDVRQGFATGNNDKFLRYWNEVDFEKLAFLIETKEELFQKKLKWVPCNKGGSFRKWYGNNEYIVAFDKNNFNKLSKQGNNLPSKQFYFQQGISWSTISSGPISFRFSPKGFVFETKGSTCFPKNNVDFILVFASLNTKLSNFLLSFYTPTLDYHEGPLRKLPFIFPNNDELKQQIDQLTQECIDISKEEWDSRETSWDFAQNELLRILNDECSMLNEKENNSKLKIKNLTLETIYNRFCSYWSDKFFTLHKSEEELNRLFIEIYELQDELTPEVALKDITILKNEAKIVDGELVFQADEIMKQFISYGVGVMFGRYSLDHQGLHIANMNESIEECNSKFEIKNSTFEVDDDNIIPVLEDDYFKDDITSRFVQFVKITFGEENLSENLRFIENSLGTTLRKYFVKGFYEDHIKRYKKRPIYWMVASPKKGFMSLIYMHRYETDTFARVRNSYLTEYIAKLEAHKETLHLTTSSETASSKDKKDADKEIKKIEGKLKELIAFDREKMMHFAQKSIEIDLDDGVKVNYCKFRDILYPITGLCK